MGAGRNDWWNWWFHFTIFVQIITKNQNFIEAVSSLYTSFLWWSWSFDLNISIIAFQHLTCPLHNHFNQNHLSLRKYRHLIQGESTLFQISIPTAAPKRSIDPWFLIPFSGQNNAEPGFMMAHFWAPAICAVIRPRILWGTSAAM